jgi:ActR/RegA family two-component response regulator
MSEKKQIRVLVVDDESQWHDIFRRRFGTRGHQPDCPYEFNVDVASSLADGVELIRTARRANANYAVLVFDLWMGEDAKAGLSGIAGLTLGEDEEIPVIIVLTAHPAFETCVRAMRDGAWDYVAKESVDGRPAAQVVVDSAVARLRELEQSKALRQEFTQWFPSHVDELRAQYPPGSVVALWNEPEILVVASGTDSFDLEQKLQDWKKGREVWQQPHVIQVPPPPVNTLEEGG